jgi:hypothetical protein
MGKEGSQVIRSTDMSSTKKITQYLQEWLDVSVRGGFSDAKDIYRELQERIDDELADGTAGERGDLQRFLEGYAAKVFTKQRKDESRWTKRTINDSIDAAFAAMNKAGIVALQNAGFTMSDGWEDVNEIARGRKKRPRGATFYHGQDLARGVAGDGLMLAYGAYVEGKGHERASLDLASDVVAILREHGVETKWDGSINQRIAIVPFRWRRRRYTKAPK